VLQAMGLEEWQTQAAVRLSFGALDSSEFIAAACARLQRCGEVLRARGLSGAAPLDASAAFASLALANGNAGRLAERGQLILRPRIGDSATGHAEGLLGRPDDHSCGLQSGSLR